MTLEQVAVSSVIIGIFSICIDVFRFIVSFKQNKKDGVL